jgi:hypothetical protein
MPRAILAALASGASMLALVASPACVVPSISTSEDAGATATATSDAASSTVVQGASCTAVSASVSLCQYISACPTLTLSTKVFPECGFWIHGSAIDPECFCQNEYLCPIGHPLTCAAAATAAGGDTDYDSVCQQALSGGCQDLATTTGPSAACQSCITACDNVPACIDACGC